MDLWSTGILVLIYKHGLMLIDSLRYPVFCNIRIVNREGLNHWSLGQSRVFQCRDGPIAACRDWWEKLNCKFLGEIINFRSALKPAILAEFKWFCWRSVKQVEIWFSNYVFDIYFSRRIIVHHHFKFKSFNKKIWN